MHESNSNINYTYNKKRYLLRYLFKLFVSIQNIDLFKILRYLQNIRIYSKYWDIGSKYSYSSRTFAFVQNVRISPENSHLFKISVFIQNIFSRRRSRKHPRPSLIHTTREISWPCSPGRTRAASIWPTSSRPTTKRWVNNQAVFCTLLFFYIYFVFWNLGSYSYYPPHVYFLKPAHSDRSCYESCVVT